MNRDQIVLFICLAIAAGIFVFFQMQQENARIEKAIIPIKESIIAAHRPRMIVFSTKYSAPCQQFQPVLDKVMTNYIESVDCQTIDVKNKANAAMMHDFGVGSIPATFIFDRKGNLIYRQVGYIEPGELDDYLRKTVL